MRNRIEMAGKGKERTVNREKNIGQKRKKWTKRGKE